MTPQPELLNELETLIAACLPGWNGTRALGERLARDYSKPDSEGNRPLVLKSRGLAIKNDDLAFLDSVLAGVKAGSAAMLATPDWGVLVAFVATIANLGRNLLNKSAELNAESIAVLTILKEHPPGLLPREVAAFLNTSSLSGKFTEEQAKELLERLGNVRLRDGSVGKLAATDAQGMWSASGV